jgi:hypothetical protein
MLKKATTLQIPMRHPYNFMLQSVISAQKRSSPLICDAAVFQVESVHGAVVQFPYLYTSLHAHLLFVLIT